MSIIHGLLLASLVGLAAGPLAHKVCQRSPATRKALDAFVAVSVGGLALFHLIPEAIASGAALAAVFALLGVLAPAWIERLGRGRAASGASWVLMVALLCVHSAVECAALAMSQPEAALSLGVAIAAHKLPVGLLVYATVRAQGSRVAAWGAIAALAATAVLGFVAGGPLLGVVGGHTLGALQGFVAGSLLHVVFAHRLPGKHHAQCQGVHPEPDADDTPSLPARIVGGALGLGVLAMALSVGHEHHHEEHGAEHAAGLATEHGAEHALEHAAHHPALWLSIGLLALTVGLATVWIRKRRAAPDCPHPTQTQPLAGRYCVHCLTVHPAE